MRPLLLKFAGIGSYPGKVEIDFSDLSAMGLYLIVGRTGAGKTTIFDAMTYALYGKVSADRENSIVSGHPGRENPFIEFTFEHAGITYIAHREPALPGKTMTPNKQWISIVGADGNETQRISQTRQVNEKVKEVIGLNDAEFMQVILLPQGKFQQFLLAKSNDKKGMLQAIFGTSAYRRIVDRMMISAKQLQLDLDQDSAEINSHWAVIRNSHETLLDHEIFEELPDYAEETRALIDAVKKQAIITELGAKATSEKFASAKTSLAQSALEAERFDKSVQLAQLQSDHTKNAKTVDKAQVSVEKHEKAEPIADAASVRDELNDDITKLTNTIDGSRSLIAHLASKVKIKSDAFKKFSDAIPTAPPSTLASEFAKVEAFITSAGQKFDELVEVTDEIDVLVQSSQSVEELQSTKSAELKLTTSQITNVKKAIVESRTATKDLKTVERAVEKLDELLEEADESEAKASITAATKLRDRLQTKFDALSANLKAEQDKRTKQLAGELASELKTGEECPVCGSTEHPKKAKKSSGDIDMESLSVKRDNQFELVKDAERDLKEAQKALKKAQDAKAKLPSDVEQKTLRTQFQKLLALSEGEDQLSNDLADLEEIDKALNKELSEAEVKKAEVNTKLTTLKKRLTILTKETQAIGVASQVEDALGVLEEIREGLDELGEAVIDLKEKQGQLKQATTNISTLLAKTDFVNEKTAVAALLDEDSLEEFENLINEASERSEMIGKLTAAIGDKPVSKTRPDLDALQEQVTVATNLNDAAQQVNGVVQGALKDITKAFNALIKISPAYTEKKKKVQSAYTIANIFDKGTTTTSGKQLDLETWVLRTLFEEVCLVANEQMRQLSNNRYTLTLEQEEGGVAKRRGGGLDIYVLDAQTGLTRPVQTMSGGEQFIASLALALALAEVVQRHAGGIEVPCLFIDEGFGGLDLETLDLAIDVLLGIQASGRSVGVITHVETMQQLLPIGIQIHKGHSGSTLEVRPS
jgi:exonuclease SbcC